MFDYLRFICGKFIHMFIKIPSLILILIYVPLNTASSLRCYECDPLAILSSTKSPDMPQCAEDNAVYGDLVNCDKSTDACSQAVFSKLNMINSF